MNNDTKVIFGAILASLIIIVGAAVVLGKDTTPKRDSMGSGSFSVDKRSEDLGSMKVSEEKTATFTITNAANDSVLRIWNIATSCNCTFATVTIGSETTGEFNMTMHMSTRLKNWMGEIPPGQTALLHVIYRPSVMPVSGPISRQVTFSTNDPKNETVEVSIRANVL